MSRIEISVSRTIPASPGEVFDLWLDRNSPGGPWFGTERVIISPVVDGLFYHSVRHEGRSWAHYGRFVRLDKPRIIEHTWVSEATRGIESTVTVTLEPKGNETLLTLRHWKLVLRLAWPAHSHLACGAERSRQASGTATAAVQAIM
jgi:uncharacterized protein YndB with AHSA1/START domain